MRRLSRFLAVLWTNLTIDKVLIEYMKIRGGLTKRSGLTESAGVLWIGTTMARAEPQSGETVVLTR